MGRLHSLKRVDIRSRRKHLVQALKKDTILPEVRPEWMNAGVTNRKTIIALSSLAFALILYSLPISVLLGLDFMQSNGVLASVLVVGGPSILFMAIRLSRPLGLLKPFWMYSYLIDK